MEDGLRYHLTILFYRCGFREQKFIVVLLHKLLPDRVSIRSGESAEVFFCGPELKGMRSGKQSNRTVNPAATASEYLYVQVFKINERPVVVLKYGIVLF